MDEKLFAQLLESAKDAEEYRRQFLDEFGPDQINHWLTQNYRDADPARDFEEYRHQFLCEFTPDPRDKALHERLAQYYREAGTNRKAWSEFKDWCRARGYTVDDINRAKRNDHN